MLHEESLGYSPSPTGQESGQVQGTAAFEVLRDLILI